MQRMTAERENELVVMAKGGDKDACGSLLWQYRWLVTKVARKVLGELATDVNIDDVTQDTFEYALTHFEDYGAGRFYRWLWSIAKNKAFETRTRAGRSQANMPVDDEMPVGWYSADGWDWTPADLAGMVRRLRVAKKKIDRYHNPDDCPMVEDVLIREEDARNLLSCLAGVLTPRELADLEMVADGKRASEIAAETGRNANAVKLSIWRSKKKAVAALVTN